jgi:hypothetical protein
MGNSEKIGKRWKKGQILMKEAKPDGKTKKTIICFSQEKYGKLSTKVKNGVK